MSVKKYGKELSVKFYYSMVLSRKFEEKMVDLFSKGMIAGNLHIGIGQEAVIGACEALKSQDIIFTSHRGHGQMLCKGTDAKAMMAEIFGKATGCCQGKGGHIHIADPANGMMGANGLVGTSIPMAAGSALASKIMKKDEVTLVINGDGATNTGEFHEALNMASAWKLPVVFVIENNKYGVTTCIDRVCNVEDLAVRAKGYGIPGVVVDGNNIFEVYEAAKKAIERARKGEGPTLIEAKTYRHLGHFLGDSQYYKPKEEIESWMKKDPIKRLQKELIESGLVSEQELNNIEEEIKIKVEEAAEFAIQSPYPSPEEITTDVYAVDNERGVAR